VYEFRQATLQMPIAQNLTASRHHPPILIS